MEGKRGETKTLMSMSVASWYVKSLKGLSGPAAEARGLGLGEVLDASVRRGASVVEQIDVVLSTTSA